MRPKAEARGEWEVKLDIDEGEGETACRAVEGGGLFYKLVAGKVHNVRPYSNGIFENLSKRNLLQLFES